LNAILKTRKLDISMHDIKEILKANTETEYLLEFFSLFARDFPTCLRDRAIVLKGEIREFNLDLRMEILKSYENNK